MHTRSRPPRFVAVLLVLLLAPGAALAKPIDAKAVDAVVQEALKTWQVPGAAVAIVHGDDVYLQGYGVREQGSDSRVTPDTIFAIGSCTKAFTTTALAILADDGKLSWDDPVRKHVAFFRLKDPLADRDVTLRDLVCHRTGMSRHDLLWYRAPWDLEETVRRIGFVEPTHSFRSTYEYNNVMYIAAGLAVTSAAKVPWNEFVQRRIFDPLGMNAVFTSLAAQKVPDHASPHLRAGADKVQVIPWYNDDNQVRASGSIKASARDMSQWVRLQLGGGAVNGKRIVSEAGLKETHTPQIVRPLAPALARAMESTQGSYGLGWTLMDYRGRFLVEHGGSVDGFRAQTTLVPKASVAVVVLCNLGLSDFPITVSRGVLDQVLGLESKDWNAILRKTGPAAPTRLPKRQPGTKPSRELDAYAGAFEHPGYGRLTVARKGEALALAWSSFKLALEHHHYDTFATRTEDPRERTRVGGQPVVFRLGADGEVTGLRFLGQEFNKKQ
jgi:CubicO group peptidase (beta-lactamase class C family)